MGLFSNSETTNKRNQILQDIAISNKALRDIGNIIDIQGINRTSISSINAIFLNVESNVVRWSNTIQGMSDSQLEGFNVPWIDGRYIGVMMWILSFNTMVQDVSSKIENYAKR